MLVGRVATCWLLLNAEVAIVFEIRPRHVTIPCFSMQDATLPVVSVVIICAKESVIHTGSSMNALTFTPATSAGSREVSGRCMGWG